MKCEAEWRGLWLTEYKSITEEYLKELQLELRENKKTLRLAMERKEAADAAAREQDARLEATHVVVFELRVESDNIADEQEERSKAGGGLWFRLVLLCTARSLKTTDRSGSPRLCVERHALGVNP